MAHNETNTYQYAKQVFTTLALNDKVTLPIPEDNLKIFRKHLSEMIKRKHSSNLYASRMMGDGLMVVRIQ